MEIDRITIKNIGPFENLNLKLNGKSIALVGENGSGKTLLISSVVDFIYEYMNNAGFRDALPGEKGLNYTYYRITSPNFLKAGARFGYVLIIGRVGGEKAVYLEQYGFSSREELATEIGMEISLIPWAKTNNKDILGIHDEKKESVREKLLSESIFFLPSNRFENESWRTEQFFSDELEYKSRYSDELGRKIEQVTSLKENYNWLVNEVADYYLFKNTPSHRTNRALFVAEFIRKVLGQKEGINLIIDQNRYDRLSVTDKNNQTIIKSFSHLSLGQLTALNMLLSILRNSEENIPIELIRGLVVVDEIDTHTTGYIQTQVIPEIIKRFSSMQFIITTHDPMSVIGIENNTDVRIVELPKGDEVLAKDYSGVKLAREQIGKLNRTLKKITKRIDEIDKPILLVEDSYTQLYKIAWLKLQDKKVEEETFEEVFKREAPFALVSAGGERSLYSVLNQRNLTEIIKNKKIIGLFDFDSAYCSFKGLDKVKWSRIRGSEKKGLYRKRNDSNMYALVLPVPHFRRALASKIFEGNSCLEIELYFSNKTLTTRNCSVDNKKPGKLLAFHGNKATFWKETIRYDKGEFFSFKSLFDRIYELLDL